MDVSIITINYNTSQDTLKAIKSLLKETNPEISYEIIVVDNASSKNDFEMLISGLKLIQTEVSIQVHRSIINTGFGGGNMLGVQHAVGKYYAFVNNDVVLKNDCISLCLSFIKNNRAAVVAPLQFNEHDEFKCSFDYFLTVKRELFGRNLLHLMNSKKYPNRKTPPERPIKVDCVAGSFMLIDSESFDQVGGFDTNIFLYHEETDLCYRILKNNLGSCFIIPEAKYTHYTGTSTEKSIHVKMELKRSMLYVLKKHSSLVAFKIFEWLFILKWFFKSLVKPSRFLFLRNLLIGESPAFSLKNKQKINRI